jgi:hypothetical protein
MSLVRFILIAAVAIATPPALAYTQKEADVLLNVSYAVATAGQKNRKGAEAFCRQAKGMLSTKAEDAYLFAHIERCFGAVAATLDDKPAACKHYKKALDIWVETPPPDDHPQSVASRAQLRDAMIRYRKENCA